MLENFQLRHLPFQISFGLYSKGCWVMPVNTRRCKEDVFECFGEKSTRNWEEKKGFSIYWKKPWRCKKDDFKCFSEKSKSKWEKKKKNFLIYIKKTIKIFPNIENEISSADKEKINLVNKGKRITSRRWKYINYHQPPTKKDLREETCRQIIHSI